MIEVELPDGSIAEFPDGTPPETIKAALQRRFRQPAPQQQFNATEGMSTFDKLAAGFGKSIVDTGRGLGQLVGLVDQQSVDAAAQRDAALMDTGAGMVGNIAGQVGQLAVPGAGAARLGAAIPKAATGLGRIGQAAAGAGAFGATQPVLSGESRAGNAATSAAFGAGGQVLGNAVGAVARGGSKALDPAREALARKADALGIPLTMAQLTDSSTVKLLSSVLDRIPFSGGGKRLEGQREAFNRAVGKTFGANAPRITAEVADQSKKALGQQFERLSARNTLKVDNQLMGDLTAITSGVAKEGTQENARIVGNLVDEFMEKAAGDKVSGKAYRELDSKLGRLMRQTNDGDRRAYVGAVRDAIRGAMDRSISPADQQAWRQVRKQYASLKTVEDLIEKAPTGDLSPALLMGRVRANNGNMAYGGGGDLADLARIGQAFLKDPIPDSGTAQRQLVHQLVAMGALGAGGAVTGVADPQDILIALAGARMGNSALNSKALQRYYQRGLGNNAQRVLSGPQSAAPYLLPATANATGQ